MLVAGSRGSHTDKQKTYYLDTSGMVENERKEGGVREDFRLRYDYITMIRVQEHKTRRHNVTLIFIFFGVLNWLLLTNTSLGLVVWWSSFLLFSFLIVLSFWVNLVIGRMDRDIDILQRKILMGQYQDVDQFMNDYQATIGKNRTRLNKYLEAGLSIGERYKSDRT